MRYSGYKNCVFDNIIHKFGHNSSVGTSWETVWESGGRYAYLSSASILKISSGSNNDDLTGSGARTVQVYGLDAEYNRIDEVVNMDGQTPVNTANSYLRIFRMIVRSAGGQGINMGTMYAGTGDVTAGVPDNVYASIANGMGQTLMALYTIPAGKKGLLSQELITNGSAQICQFMLAVRPLGEVFQVKDLQYLYQRPFIRPFEPPLMIPEKSDIEIVAKSNASTSKVTGTFCILLVE